MNSQPWSWETPEMRAALETAHTAGVLIPNNPTGEITWPYLGPRTDDPDPGDAYAGRMAAADDATWAEHHAACRAEIHTAPVLPAPRTQDTPAPSTQPQEAP